MAEHLDQDAAFGDNADDEAYYNALIARYVTQYFTITPEIPYVLHSVDDTLSDAEDIQYNQVCPPLHSIWCSLTSIYSGCFITSNHLFNFC